MITLRSTALPLLLCLMLAGRAWAVFDPQSDMPDGMGNTVSLVNPSPSEALSLPACGLTNGGLAIETGYCRKFAMKELDRFYVAAAARFGRWSTSVGVSQFGQSELYAEKTARLAVAAHFDSLALGVSLSAEQLEFGGGYDNLSAATVGVSGGYSMGRLRTALSFENLTRPRLSAAGPRTDIISALYLQLLGPGSYSVAARLTVEQGEKAQLGLGQKIRLSRLGSFFWGISSQPTTYGGGVELNYQRYVITAAATYHPVLGLTHTIAVSFFGGRTEK